MKVEKKTNHFQEDADKIQQIPERKNDGLDGQEKPSKAKKQKKNRFLACLRKTWARFTRCMRSCISIQKERSAEELPTPSRNNMEEDFPEPSDINSKEELPSANKEEELPGLSQNNMEEEFPEPRDINFKEELPMANNEEELSGPSGGNVGEEFPEPRDINFKEELPTANKEEELPTPSRSNMEEEFPESRVFNSKEELSTANKDEELPGSSSEAKVSSEEQEQEDDVEENQNIEPNNVEAELVTDSFVEQAEYQHLNDLIRRIEDLCPQYNAMYLEILAEYNQMKDQIQSLEHRYVQYYNLEDGQENGEEQLESTVENAEVKNEVDGVNEEQEREEGSSEESDSKSASLEEELHKYTNTSQNGRSDVKHEQPGEESTATAPITLQSLTRQQSLGEVSIGEVILASQMTDTSVVQDIQAEYQHLINVIQILEGLCAQFYDTQREILVAYDRINDQIQSLEDRYIQVYKEEDEQSGEEQLDSKVGDAEVKNELDGEQQAAEELENKLEDNEEVKIKESGESINDSQEACFLQIDNESSKDKEKDEDKGENISFKINEESKCGSLEEELHKTSQSGRRDYRSDFCSPEEDISEEPHKSTNPEKLEQAGEASPAATVPLTLQSFTFHQKLGQGGFGEVYLATDNIRKECVAIKVTDKLYFKCYGSRFEERNILEMSHKSPHLIHGLAAFHTKNFVYYVMELAPRGDLYDFMYRNCPLDHHTIQFIIAEVICGVQFLHKKGIIHRDLKPENILLSADGHVKIVDFGFAATGVYKKTKGECLGTVSYMAPEMVRSQEHGKGVDYFAIGVILYMMYMSKYPFPGRNDSDINLAVLYSTPKYPDFLTPDTVDLLQGLLHKDQKYRLGVKGDVRKHPYFANINWEDVEAGRALPPAIMTAAPVNQNMNRTLDYEERRYKIRSKDQKIFKGFNFICQEWAHHYHDADTLETKSWMANLFARMPCKKRAN